MRSLLALALLAGASVGPRYGDTLAASVPGGGPVRGDARSKSGASITIGPEVAGSSAPLADALGAPIGTVTVEGRPERARAAAAWLSRRIYVADDLAAPDPFVPGTARAARAQALVERMIHRFPDLITLAFHASNPGSANAIVASSFGRIGKVGDADDLRVERDGAVLREVTNGGRRLAVELPLHDRAGRTIGALSTSFRVSPGTDPETAYARALAVRDELARGISSREGLLAPRPAHAGS